MLKLVAITWQESRRRFFEQQLASAKRRMKRAVSCGLEHDEISEYGDAVSYYEWAVKKAQEEMEDET